MDIRAERTRAMLVRAFDELSEEKPIEKITVSELCARSTVRRATFYRHFGGMSEFLRYYLSTLTARFMDEIGADADLDELVPYARRMHAHMLGYAYGRQATFRHMLGPAMLADTMDMIVVQVADGIVSRIRALQECGEALLGIRPETIGLHYSAGIVHSMRWRLLEEHPELIEDVVERHTALLERMVFGDRST